MAHPAEQAASAASASSVNWAGIGVSWAGNGLGYLTVHQADVQTVVLMLTGAYTLWQFARDWIKDKRDRDGLAKLAAWARRNGMQTAPAPLTPDQRHSTSPTPLWDDTYPHDQKHHEGK